MLSNFLSVIGVFSIKEFIKEMSSSLTDFNTSSPALASPATIPALAATIMPFIPPVLGTTTDFAFFIIFPLASIRRLSGREPI